MNNYLIEKIEELQKMNNISIIYACESGSRAYGSNSLNSDFDVRFIYTYSVNDYLRVDKQRDSLVVKLTNTLEMNGWDLFKAMELFSKSNPSLYECLFSPIVYKEIPQIFEELRYLAAESFSLQGLAFHYANLVKSNIKQLKRGHQKPYQQIKTIFQTTRGLLMVHFIFEYYQLPPIRMEKLIKSSTYSIQQKEQLKQIVVVKAKNKNSNFDYKSLLLFLEEEILFLYDRIRLLPVGKKEKHKINEIIWKTLNI